MLLDPCRLGLVRDDAANGIRHFRRRLIGAIGLEYPGLGFDDLGERPQRDALPVRQATALTPADEVRIGVDVMEELEDEPALADARFADERDELDDAVASRPFES